MLSEDVEQKINNFLRRKKAEFPELAISGREESRTMKYANELRASGQMLMTR